MISMQQTAQSRVGAPVRVLGLLVGDARSAASSAHIKYGQLFDELAARCELLDVADVELQGFDRYQNALRSLRWPKQRWREAFRKNIWAFHQRSQRAQAIVARHGARVDVVLQHGAIFWAGHERGGPPVVIYTDFNYQLAAREDPWRNPFGPAEGQRWDALERRAYHQAALTLTRSDYVRRSLIKDYGVAPERVVTVGSGVNFEQLPEAAPLVDTPRVLFIGKEFERKGGPQLVAAFEQARLRVPEAELWMVTEAEPSGPGIRRIAPTNDRAAIADLYRAASVFAMPSRCETWGDVFLEAMAYGLPCIGTTNDAMPEIIAHGESGYVVGADDVPALAAYLERLLREPVLRRSMGAYGRQRVISTFTWGDVTARIQACLEQVKEESDPHPDNRNPSRSGALSSAKGSG